jgi:predicted O-linked N-acetylglucosamine transferase (SPINDLY family)
MQGIALHQQGRLADADAAYHRLCVLQPRHAHALHCRGIVALQLNRPAAAVELISAALELLNTDPTFHANLARAQVQLGLAADALASLDRALGLDPRFVGALVDRGNVLLDLARRTEALDAFRRALALDPNEPSALNGAGNALLEEGRAAEAAEFFTRAINARPDEAAFVLNRALAHSSMHRPEDVLRDCRRSRELGHGTAQLYFLEGNSLLDLGRAAQAIEAFDRALAIDPALAGAHNNRGTALVGLGRHAPALASFEQCLELTSASADGSLLALQARLNRCAALKELGRRPEALAGFQELHALAPDLEFVRGLLLHEQLTQCDWHDYQASVRAIVDAIDRGRPADGPFTFLAVNGSASSQLRCAQLHAATAAPLHARPPDHRRRECARDRRRLRIAYLSSDLREHAVSYLMAGIFEAHDRSRFEIYGISTGIDDRSAMRQRIEASFDHWLDAAGLQDAAIGAWMVERSIDLLVDLNGHTSGGRRALLAQRCAPLQVNYLGYPGTAGAAFMDYLIADEIVIPPESRQHYSEQVVYLPGCFQANDDKRSAVATCSRAEAGLPADGFVFCSFNNSHKFNPVMFDIWCRLLRAVPGSVLWTALSGETARANLRREAEARGVDAARLLFAGQQPYARHLGRLRHADLFLDTLPFNAGATASDALWAGLPLITCLGDAFAARMAGSLLHALALPELITENLAGYEGLALELASNPARLAGLRARLDTNRRTSPLFDTKRQCRNLEAAYAGMWARHLRGEAPASFKVDDPG